MRLRDYHELATRSHAAKADVYAAAGFGAKAAGHRHRARWHAAFGGSSSDPMPYDKVKEPSRLEDDDHEIPAYISRVFPEVFGLDASRDHILRFFMRNLRLRYGSLKGRDGAAYMARDVDSNVRSMIGVPIEPSVLLPQDRVKEPYLLEDDGIEIPLYYRRAFRDVFGPGGSHAGPDGMLGFTKNLKMTSRGVGGRDGPAFKTHDVDSNVRSMLGLPIQQAPLEDDGYEIPSYLRARFPKAFPRGVPLDDDIKSVIRVLKQTCYSVNGRDGAAYTTRDVDSVVRMLGYVDEAGEPVPRERR